MGIVKDLARSPRPEEAAGTTPGGLYLTLAPGKIVDFRPAVEADFFLVLPLWTPKDHQGRRTQ